MEYIFLFFTLIAALITYQLISLAIVYIWWHWPEKVVTDPDLNLNNPKPMATYRENTS